MATTPSAAADPLSVPWSDSPAPLVELSRRFRLVRYDERGCGLSDWDIGRFSFPDWVDDLGAVVDAAGLDRFSLLGISQGGPVAIAYAVRHPERVSHLVLLARSCRWAACPRVRQAERDR